MAIEPCDRCRYKRQCLTHREIQSSTSGVFLLSDKIQSAWCSALKMTTGANGRVKSCQLDCSMFIPIEDRKVHTPVGCPGCDNRDDVINELTRALAKACE